MATKRLDTVQKTVLLDLPERIFVEIFQHLEYHYVFLNLRMVCHRIKEYVDNYIQLGGIFFSPKLHQILYEGAPLSGTYFVFKRHHQVVSVYCEISAPVPKPRSWDITKEVFRGEIGDFCLLDNNKLIISILRDKRGAQGRYTILSTKAQFVQYQYNQERKTWSERIEKTFYRNYNKRYFEYDVSMSSCPIGNLKILSFVNHKKYLKIGEVPKPNKLFMLDFKIRKSNLCNVPLPCLISKMALPTPLRTLVDFSMINISKNKVLVIGGGCLSAMRNDQYNDQVEHTNNANRLIWEGTVNNKENDINWISLDCKIPKAFFSPICFKLKENIYIVGYGNCDYESTRYIVGHTELIDRHCDYKSIGTCDKYNLLTSEYHENVWPLPYSVLMTDFMKLYKPSVRVMIDQKETFAIIKNAKYNEQLYKEATILLFTEKGGFENVPFHYEDMVKYNISWWIDL